MNWDLGGSSNFEQLIGETLTKVSGAEKASEEIIFECASGKKARLIYHEDCCAGCTVEDVCGDINDLLNSPILLAELMTSKEENPPGVPPKEYQDSFTWAFYKLATIKGAVTIRWYGESNGFYSEEASFEWQIQK